MLILFFILLSLSAVVENSYAQLNRYWVPLFPPHQAQPKVIEPIGFVGFKFSDDFNELVYNVNVHNINNITGVYLCLKVDTHGAYPVLDLLKKHKISNREVDRWSNLTKEGKITGTINLNGVTKKHLTGPLDGKSIQDLHQLMIDGKLYIAVLTKNYPRGELKGDSFNGMDDVFHGADEFNWR